LPTHDRRDPHRLRSHAHIIKSGDMAEADEALSVARLTTAVRNYVDF
jgi:hypothetical protein